VFHLTHSKRAAQTAAAVALGALTLGYGATAAWADTSTSSAQAINLSLGGGSVLNSGTESASNPGGQPTVTNGDQPPLNLLGTQSTIAAGVLAQTAVAFGNGSSAACAGLVGAGGQIQIGTDGSCAVTGATTGGVSISLPDLVSISATAILEECSTTSTGTPTASAQLVDATVDVSGVPLVTLPVNPTAGQSISTAVLSLNLNTQTTPQASEIQGTALSLNVLNTIVLNIGTVTCGPNAVTGVSSVFPPKSLPIAGGTAAVLGGVGVVWYRRRTRVQPS
jgi:hypothetical protein